MIITERPVDTRTLPSGREKGTSQHNDGTDDQQQTADDTPPLTFLLLLFNSNIPRSYIPLYFIVLQCGIHALCQNVKDSILYNIIVINVCPR